MCKIVRPQKIYVAKYYEINKKLKIFSIHARHRKT